jgi:hypothetical protein
MNLIAFEARPGALDAAGWQKFSAPAGQSVREIVLSMYGAEDGICAWVMGRAGTWEQIPRHQWPFVRPAKSDVLRFTFRPHGGGKNNLFATVAAVALAVLLPGIGTALTAAFGAFAGGLATAAIGIGTSLLIQKLFPAEGQRLAKQDTSNTKGLREVNTDSNLLARDQILPIVIDRVISPYEICEPRIQQVDGIDTVRRVFALNGRHSISNIKVDGTPISDSPSIVTTETRDGLESSGTYTSFMSDVAASVSINEALSTFIVSGTSLEDQDTPRNSEPRWMHFTTPGHDNLSEVVIRTRLDTFLKTTDDASNVRLPLRIRVRPAGGDSGDWINFPEVHIIGNSQRPATLEHRFRWDDFFGAIDQNSAFTYEFWTTVPAAGTTLSDGNTGVQWQANTQFDTEIGSGLQRSKNIRGRRNGLQVVLSESVLPKGALEWQIMRGYASIQSTLNSSYQISGTVESLFVAKSSGGWSIAVNQNAHVAQASIIQASAIANEPPCQLPGTAVVGIQSKGQSVVNVSMYASRYVLDWNGSAWATSTASSTNPATHYRQVLVDHLDAMGVDDSVIDNDAFVAWRTECAARGYACSAVMGGDSIGDTLAALAVAGFARPVFGVSYSIDYFKDRSAESPVQTFSPRNCSSISAQIVNPDRPLGVRASFENADDEYRSDEIQVTLGNAVDVSNFEAVTFSAISDPDLVRRRATFDLLQRDKRRRQWIVETSIEGVVCSVGDLVSVVSDLFDDKSHGARIRSALNSTTLVLDQSIPATAASDWADTPSVANLFTVGERSLAFVSTEAGVEQRTITAMDGNVIVLDSALTDTDNLAGAHVSITNLTNASHRCFVTSIQRQNDETAILTLVDEAPEIWSEMQRLFG